MSATKIILACVVAVSASMSVAFAQQSMSGVITKIDRLNGTVEIQQTQEGTVGANTGGAAEFKVQNGLSLEDVHAGDRVTFSVTDDSAKTITKLQKQ